MKKSKVILIPCTNYEPKTVHDALTLGFEALGDLSALWKSQDNILLKPNLLRKSTVEQAITTHPAIFEETAHLMREMGFKNLFYGDSPGTGSTEKAAQSVGIEEAAKRQHVLPADFTSGNKVSYYKGNIKEEFVICKGVQECTSIVNLCKMKTHALERITGAVKNMYGCIYGVNKAKGHAKYPDADSFGRMLVALNLYLQPRLHIMDGVIAMEGNGPAAGTPVCMNLILMSTDPVALDSVFCRLVNLDPKLVATNHYGHIMGLGTYKEDEIDVWVPCDKNQVAFQEIDKHVIEKMSVREAAERYGNKQFDVFRGEKQTNVWSKFGNILKPFGRKPYIQQEKCIRCGICVESCPVDGKAIKFKQGKAKPPQYDYKKCIRCYCCQEMCPKEAIHVKRGFC